MNKPTAVFALTVFLCTSAFAAPTTLTYAGQLTDGGVAKEGAVDVVIELFTAASGGSAVFTEALSNVLVVGGELVVEVGATQDLDDSVLAHDALFVQVTVDDSVLSPRSPVRAVPFALQANDAQTLEGLSAADISAQIAQAQATLQADVDTTTSSVSAVDGRVTALTSTVTTVDNRVTTVASSVTAVDNRVTTLTSRVAAVEASDTAVGNRVTALSTAGGPAVAFANVTGVVVSTPVSFGSGTIGISSNAITADHLAPNAVNTSELVDTSVTTAKLHDGAVTRAKLNGAVQVFASAGCPTQGLRAGTFTCSADACSNVFIPSGHLTCAGGCNANLLVATCAAAVVGVLVAP